MPPGDICAGCSCLSECLGDYIFGERTGGPRLSLKGMELCVGTLEIFFMDEKEKMGKWGRNGENKGYGKEEKKGRCRGESNEVAINVFWGL